MIRFDPHVRARRDSVSSLLTLIASLLLATFGGIGCGDPIGIDPASQTEAFDLDPGRLRPDFRPLSSGQARSGARETYSDGNVYDDRGNVTVTGGAPLSPLRIADIDGALNDQLTRAGCLWVDKDNESARVSWELVALNTEIPEWNALIPEFSGCGGTMIDPDTRAVPFYEDMDTGEVEQAMGQAGVFFDIEMTIHTGAAGSDPFHGCDAGDPRIVSRPMRVVALNGAARQQIAFPSNLSSPFDYPYCANQAALPRIEEDWTMQLDVINPDTGSSYALQGMNAPPFVLPTRIKVVEPSMPGDEFLLSRPLRYLGEREARVNGDRTITPIGWTWRAGILGDGRWEENFSPNLAISRIRVFRNLGVDPDTGGPIREYLPAAAIDAYSDPGLLRGDREIRCNFVPGSGEDPPACLDAVGFTPTYRIDRDNVGTRLTDLLTWVVEFNEVVECQPYQRPDGTMDCMEVVVETPPVDERDRELYVEFHLVRPSTATSGQGLIVSPAASDFGDVLSGRTPTFEDVFELQNFGQGAIRITDVALEGPDASLFEVQPSASKLIGERIETSGRLSLDVSVRSDSRHYGRRQASLRVSAEDVHGRPMSVRANLRATITDWHLEAVHTPFLFLRHEAQHPWDDTPQWQKPLLILNTGSADMPRGQISIAGPGAAHWSIVRETSEYLPREDYVPWILGEAPQPTRTIVPGDSELFWVVYHPDVPYLRSLYHGPDEAELRFQVGDAEYTIPLEGWCVDRCAFQAPTPYAPPSHGGGVKIQIGAQIPPRGGGGLIEVESQLAP